MRRREGKREEYMRRRKRKRYEKKEGKKGRKGRKGRKREESESIRKREVKRKMGGEEMKRERKR